MKVEFNYSDIEDQNDRIDELETKESSKFIDDEAQEADESN